MRQQTDMPQAAATDFEHRLAKEVASCYGDPLRFVRTMYPWGEPNTSLAHATGPDVWQAEFLTRLGAAVRQRQFDSVTAVQPIRMAVSSGHGIGKSTLVAWIVNWIMSTRTNSRGTITANTFTQVQDKTWAAIRKWTPLCLTGPWFEVTAERMRRRDHPESQFFSATSCREENSEAFAGQHERTSSSFYIFDEASAVPDSIYEVAEGGLTDGEPMIFLFGNPTRSTGMFHRDGKANPTADGITDIKWCGVRSSGTGVLPSAPMLALVRREHGRCGRTGHPRIGSTEGTRGEEARVAGTQLTAGPFEGPSSNRPLRGR